MSLQLVYEDSLLGGQAEYTAQCQGFSQLQSLSFLPEFNQTPYYGVISLEHNSWYLSGAHLPVERQHMPYWGAVLSDEKGQFATPPQLTVTLPKNTSASGMTMRFWPEEGQWCSRFTARWYRADVPVAEKTFYPTAADFSFHFPVRNFDRVVLSWEQTNLPFRFPKLQGLVIGQKLIFGEEALVKVQLHTEVDPINFTLSPDPLTVELRCPERPICPQQQQKVSLLRDGVCLARRQIAQVRNLGKGHCILQCNSPIMELEDRFWGGYWNGDSAEFVANQILDGRLNFHMDKSFQSMPIYGHLGISSLRKALQQLAFVLGARVIFREDWLHFLPLETGLGSTVDGAKVFLGGEMRTEAPLIALNVTAHDYRWDDTESLLLDCVPVHGQWVRLPLSRPAWDFRIEGGRLVDCGINYVTVNADGPVSVWGVVLKHSRTIHSRQQTGEGRQVSVTGNTLISPLNVEAVMDRLANAYENRQLLQQRVLPGDYEPGQLLQLPTPFGSEFLGQIVAVDKDLAGQDQSTALTLRGIEL